MKKTFIPLHYLLLFSIYNVAQTQNHPTIEMLLEINNGSEIFNKLIETSLPNIAPHDQNEFKIKAESLVKIKKLQAKKYFEKKYSVTDLDEIYEELKQPDKFVYDIKTTAFLKEWRSFKTEFQTEFKMLYNAFQK